MSVNEKMTAIADEIRELSGTTEAMGLDAMASNVSNANTEIANQEELLAEIASALEGKAIKTEIGVDVEANFYPNTTVTIEIASTDGVYVEKINYIEMLDGVMHGRCKYFGSDYVGQTITIPDVCSTSVVEYVLKGSTFAALDFNDSDTSAYCDVPSDYPAVAIYGGNVGINNTTLKLKTFSDD